MPSRYELLAICCASLAGLAILGEGYALAGESQGAMIMPRPQADNDAGFRAIFDGKTLEGWDGDPIRWRVEQSSIVGETSTPYDEPEGTFLIWRGEVLRDFELKLEYRVSR